jgi:hypothetical protein
MVSGGGEVVGGLGWRDEIDETSDGVPERRDGSFRRLAQERLHLNDPIFQGLAISLLFGLASSTVLTVLVNPAIYIVLRSNRVRMTQQWMRHRYRIRNSRDQLSARRYSYSMSASL